MREIKFRAWYNNEMWSVSELYSNGGMEISKNGHGFKFYQPTNIPIMQYTGLHDKNGKEIFDGDILKYISFVEFKTFFLNVMWSDDYSAFVVKNDNEFYLLSDLVSSDCEIAGNIYENKLEELK